MVQPHTRVGVWIFLRRCVVVSDTWYRLQQNNLFQRDFINNWAHIITATDVRMPACVRWFDSLWIFCCAVWNLPKISRQYLDILIYRCIMICWYYQYISTYHDDNVTPIPSKVSSIISIWWSSTPTVSARIYPYVCGSLNGCIYCTR